MRRAAALLALLASCACRSLPWGADDAPSAVAVRTDLQVIVPADGALEATKASPVAVPRVPTGALKVKEPAPEGTLVAPGDVVTVFDDTQLTIELSNHRASFRSAERRIDRNRLEGSIEKGAISVMKDVAQLEEEHVSEFAAADPEVYSKIEMLKDQVRLTDAQETIVFANAGLRLRGEYYDIEDRILGVEREQAGGKAGRAETSLGQLVLKAPLGGMVVYKKNWRGASASVGDTLWPGNVVMSIVDPTSVALRAYLLERDALGVAAGAPATVTVDAWPERTFNGKVRSVADIASPIERGSPVKYFEVWIDLDDGDPQLLKPGMKARSRIRAAEAKQAIVIPRAALSGTPEEPVVTVVSRDGTATRPVKLGPGDAVRVAVTEGLAEGERVLVGDDGKGAAGASAPGGERRGPRT